MTKTHTHTQTNAHARTQTTRGTGADIIIVDEAAHVDPALFYKVIVPILQLRNTCLLALSSPEGDSNYYSELMNLKDDTTGEMFFKIVDCVMVCAECKKLERSEWLRCNHVKQTAFWLDSRKTHRIKMLYKTDPALAAREIQGVVVSDYMPCFQKHDVEAVFALPPVVCTAPPRYLFTAGRSQRGRTFSHGHVQWVLRRARNVCGKLLSPLLRRKCRSHHVLANGLRVVCVNFLHNCEFVVMMIEVHLHGGATKVLYVQKKTAADHVHPTEIEGVPCHTFPTWRTQLTSGAAR